MSGRPENRELRRWEWCRLDGTRLRSGTFEQERQAGEWTTYDRAGAPYRTTMR